MTALSVAALIVAYLGIGFGVTSFAAWLDTSRGQGKGWELPTPITSVQLLTRR